MVREMKDSGIEWIGEIPATWKISRLKHHLRRHEPRNPGNAIVLSLYRELGVIPKDSRSDNHNVTSEDTSNYKYVQPGNFVVNKMKAWQGSVAISEYEGIVSPAYFIYQFTDNVYYKKYFHYLLRGCYKDEFMRLSGGIRVGQWDLSSNALDNILILVPSVSEQKSIASFLEDKCADIDNIFCKTRASIEEYRKLKQAVITQAITKGVHGNRPMKDSGIEWIGEIPAEWGITNIGRMCFVTKLAGFEFTNDMVANITDEGEVPIVRAQNIKMGRFLNSISEYISLQLSQKLNRCALDKKCLIITFIGAGIGEVAIFNEEKRYHLAPNVAKIVINDDKKQFISEEYLLYFLMSSAGQEEINRIKKATAQPSLSMETIRDLKCIIPRTVREQEEIVAVLDQKCAEIDALIAKKTALLEEIENYKKSVVYEYVTGKKEVRYH